MTTTFTAKKLTQLRRRASKAAKQPDKLPEGWFKSIVDPMDVLAVFNPLRIKDGYILRAYQCYAGGNGDGFVWAMPVDAEFPDPEDCPRLEGAFLKPPVPPSALENVMDAIDGDGSSWSYMYASLLAREFAEFGAMWHGCSWDTHYVWEVLSHGCCLNLDQPLGIIDFNMSCVALMLILEHFVRTTSGVVSSGFLAGRVARIEKC